MGHSERIKRVLLDTSILMMLYEGVDILGDIERELATKPECIVLSTTIEELKKLAMKPGVKKKRAARLALAFIEKHCRVVDYPLRPGEDHDTAFLRFVLENPDVMPVTADRELRRRLREKGIPNIYYREEKHGLELEG